jgi:hypothetical protein
MFNNGLQKCFPRKNKSNSKVIVVYYIGKGRIMNFIIFFIRGLWRELVCLKNKFTALDSRGKFFVVMITLGAFGGNFIGASLFPPHDLNNIALMLLIGISCGVLGAIFLSVVPCALYLFIEHTIKVGKE